MKKKILTAILFITIPIWVFPVGFYIVLRAVWKDISEYVNRKVK